MMNLENNRFPNSSELFFLCKEILNIKHARGEKVTDQDVGALLDFDPADCTHWKYGRKNIKAIQSLHQIADKLGLDSRALADVAQGRVGYMDIVQDFRNYGSFECDPVVRSRLLYEATQLVEKAKIKSLPIFIPELISIIPNVAVCQQEAQEDLIEENYENGGIKVTWPKKVRLCGSLRFNLLNKIATFYLINNAERLGLDREVKQAESNLFTLFLLMPTHLLQLASCQRDPAHDLVDEFSKYFWLTRSLVNIRLKDFFLYKN
jgi:hypothetical protein